MARMNLAINDSLYEKLKKEAEKKGVTPNNLLYSILQERYGKDGFDLLEEFEKIKEEVKDQKGEFSLNSLQSFQNIEEKLKENNYPESPAQVKARLGRMFQNAVDASLIDGVEKVMIEKPDGSQAQKTLCRALMYYNKLSQKDTQKNE